MTIAEAMTSDLFRNIRELGKLKQARDHVAGCIAQDKREQMITIAANDKCCLNAGGDTIVRDWEAMNEPFRLYQNNLTQMIDCEVTFNRKK